MPAPGLSWPDPPCRVDPAQLVRLGELSPAELDALLLGYLQRIADLEHQVRSLQGQLGQPPQLPREGPTPWREPHA